MFCVEVRNRMQVFHLPCQKSQGMKSLKRRLMHGVILLIVQEERVLLIVARLPEIFDDSAS